MKLRDVPGLEMIIGTSGHKMTPHTGEETLTVRLLTAAGIGPGYLVSDQILEKAVLAEMVEESRFLHARDVVMKLTQPWSSAYISSQDAEGVYATSSCIIFRLPTGRDESPLLSGYLAAILALPSTIERMRALSTGTATSTLKKTTLAQFDIPCPDADIQKRAEEMHIALIANERAHRTAAQAAAVLRTASIIDLLGGGAL